MRKTPCKGCGREIVFATTSTGRKVPLDPSAAVYQVEERSDGNVSAHLWKRSEGAPMVSHFATCPKADQFSASKRNGGNDGN